MGEIRTRLINTLFVYLEKKIFFLEMKTYFIILFLLSMYKVDVENEVKVENEVEVENEGEVENEVENEAEVEKEVEVENEVEA